MKFSTLITIWTAVLGVGAVVAIAAQQPSKQVSAQPPKEISVPWDQLARPTR
jgi:hypothetical protein